MFSPPPLVPTGDFLLPVCISDEDISDLVSALDLYRVMRKSGLSYGAFNAVLDAIEYADNPDDSPCIETVITDNPLACTLYDTFNAAYSYYPNDPYTAFDEDDRQIYLQWVTWGDIVNFAGLPVFLRDALANISENLIGYVPSDIITVPRIETSLNPITRLESFLDNIAQFPFPTVDFNFVGSGVLAIELLNVPLGGRALITIDSDLSITDIYDLIVGLTQGGFEPQFNVGQFSFVELNRDLLAIPPETAATQIQEFKIEDEGLHNVKVHILPTFNDEAPFIFPFGGVRSITLCGANPVAPNETNRQLTRYDLRRGYSTVTSNGFRDLFPLTVLASGQSVPVGYGGVVNADSEAPAVIDVNAIDDPRFESESVRSGFTGGLYRMVLEWNEAMNALEARVTNGQAIPDILLLLPQLYFTIELWLEAYLLLFDNGDVPAPRIEGALADDCIEYMYSAQGSLSDRFKAFAYQSPLNFPPDVLSAFVQAVDLFDEQQYEKWFRLGTLQPREEWRAYPVTLIYPFELKMTGIQLKESTRVTGGVFPPRTTLIRVDVSGSFTNDVGQKIDAFWTKQVDGTLLAGGVTLESRTTGNTAVSAFYNQPQYREDGNYTVYARFGFSGSFIRINIVDNRNQSANIASPSTEVVLTWKFTDLGKTL